MDWFRLDLVESGSVQTYNFNNYKIHVLFEYILDLDHFGYLVLKVPKLDPKIRKYWKTLKILETPKIPEEPQKTRKFIQNQTRKLKNTRNFIRISELYFLKI